MVQCCWWFRNPAITNLVCLWSALKNQLLNSDGYFSGMWSLLIQTLSRLHLYHIDFPAVPGLPWQINSSKSQALQKAGWEDYLHTICRPTVLGLSMSKCWRYSNISYISTFNFQCLWHFWLESKVRLIRFDWCIPQHFGDLHEFHLLWHSFYQAFEMKYHGADGWLRTIVEWTRY